MDECEDVLTATRTGITELQQLQQVVYDQERRIKDKEKSIDTILTVPEAEMLAQLQNFDKVTEQKNRLVEELRTKVDVESVNLHEKREVVNQLIMKKGQSESLKSQSQQMQSQLLSLCQSVQLKNSFSLSYRWSVYEPKAVQALLDLLQQQVCTRMFY